MPTREMSKPATVSSPPASGREDELYEAERFTSFKNSFAKITDYNLQCNLATTNSYRKNQTDWFGAGGFTRETQPSNLKL
jgi:hypothetical protein